MTLSCENGHRVLTCEDEDNVEQKLKICRKCFSNDGKFWSKEDLDMKRITV